MRDLDDCTLGQRRCSAFANRGLVPALLFLTSACGGIDGTVIDGYAGDARAAANIRVEVRGDAATVERLCQTLSTLVESAPGYAIAFNDSIRRENAARPASSRVPPETIEGNISMSLYGDPYAPLRRRLVATADSIDALEVWSGTTDLHGAFSTDRLRRGDYLITAGSSTDYTAVGLRRAEIQMSYGSSREYLDHCPGGREQIDYPSMRFEEISRWSR